ncbi:hypothetical protein [Nocardia bhagyanarayanae]|uniref:Uncharacterized protein n=1 Tax=Nocardia bhagyanarayanae TaxID=1215925 RepID=A0A543F7U0_9NOCA|nr:hypothetical protein [Nocardia bhagyanarayanae]TQM29894.1 hypothetical protein FB390_1507 [Nocardia bhagyanarayanae]
MIAAVCVVLPLLAGCGDETSTAPDSSTAGAAPTTVASTGTLPAGDLSQSDIATALSGKGLPPKQSECVARIYVEEKISQDGLRRILTADLSGPVDPVLLGLSAEDQTRVGTATQRMVQECIF